MKKAHSRQIVYEDLRRIYCDGCDENIENDDEMLNVFVYMSFLTNKKEEH